MARRYEKPEWHDPEELSAQANGLARVYRDCWWPVDKDGRVPVWRAPHGLHPMCNRDRWIVETLGKRFAGDAAVGVKQISLVLIQDREDS